MAHQPGYGFGFPLVEAEPGPQLGGDIGAELGMIAAPALGDIVQQEAKVKRRERLHLADHRTRRWVFLLEPAVLDALEDADGADGVLVHGVDVIHVVLHLPDDTAEIGQETAEYPRFVEPHQGNLGVLAGQHLHEQAVGLYVLLQLGVDELQVLGHLAERVGMDVGVVLLSKTEEPQHPHRVFLEGAFFFDRQAVAIENETVDLVLFENETGQPETPPAFLLLFLEDGAENPGQVTDVLGDQEVMLHEPLDALDTGAVGIFHPRADFVLDVEG